MINTKHCTITLVILILFLFGLSNFAFGASVSERLAGRILLQVEQNGEAWYVNPDSLLRYYLRDGDAAYQIMREQSLGISNADLDRIPVGLNDRISGSDYDADGLIDQLEEGLQTNAHFYDTDGDGYWDYEEVEKGFNPNGTGLLPIDLNFAAGLAGRILLQVEQNGQAWYVNPEDNKRYYMKDGAAAYEIMRFLSLGITDINLQQITPDYTDIEPVTYYDQEPEIYPSNPEPETTVPENDDIEPFIPISTIIPPEIDYPIIYGYPDCPEGQMYYKGQCTTTCIDFDDGDPDIFGLTVFSRDDGDSIKMGVDNFSREVTCMEGEITHVDVECEYEEINSTCLNQEVRWNKFLQWMGDQGYDQQIIDYYQAEYDNPDPEYATFLAEYLLYRDMATEPDSFYQSFKTSTYNTPYTLKMVEIYPTEPGWTYKRNTTYYAESRGQIVEEYLAERSEEMSLALGKKINVELEQYSIDYDEYIWGSENYDYKYEPFTQYKNGDMSANYQVDENWSEYSIDGYYSTLDTIDQDQLSLFISPDYIPTSPGASFVFMGATSPENYYFYGSPYMTQGCYGQFSQSYITCSELGNAYTTFTHELGHLFNLPHATVHYEPAYKKLGMPTVLGASTDDWPCLDPGAWPLLSPIERYVIEPESGFDYGTEAVNHYNEALLCD